MASPVMSATMFKGHVAIIEQETFCRCGQIDYLNHSSANVLGCILTIQAIPVSYIAHLPFTMMSFQMSPDIFYCNECGTSIYLVMAMFVTIIICNRDKDSMKKLDKTNVVLLTLLIIIIVAYC